MEWLIIYKTHLYALFVIIWQELDALIFGNEVNGDAILYHTIIFLNNLEEKDGIITLS